jgi:hypothetical protein
MPAAVADAHFPAHAHVYAMRMYSERLQILISKEQRRRLEAEAKRRKSSVASVIRDAVDAELAPVGREQRLEALDTIARMNAGPPMEPDELRRLIDDAHAEEAGRGLEGLGPR